MELEQQKEINQAQKIADKFCEILEAEHATNYTAVLAAHAIIAMVTKKIVKKIK